MLKIVGSAVFLAGVAGTLLSWNIRKMAPIRRIQIWIDFMNATEYAMEIDHVNMTIYMEQATINEPVLMQTIRETGMLLKRKQVPFGEEAWEKVCEKYRKEWDMSEEVWSLILSCKHVFFGKNLTENIEKSKEIRKRLNGLLEEEKRRFAEQKKIYIPVGMLGSCMFLLIFL